MSNLVTSKLFFSLTQSAMLLLAKLVLDDKMFGNSGGFPDGEETFSCSDILRLSSREVFPAFVKLLWGPFSIVIYSSQVVRGISVRQNDVWRRWPLWQIYDRCYRAKRGQGEASDQKKTTNYTKWDTRQFQSFIEKVESDLPSPPGSMEALRPLGAPPADWENQKR